MFQCLESYDFTMNLLVSPSQVVTGYACFSVIRSAVLHGWVISYTGKGHPRKVCTHLLNIKYWQDHCRHKTKTFFQGDIQLQRDQFTGKFTKQKLGPQWPKSSSSNYFSLFFQFHAPQDCYYDQIKVLLFKSVIYWLIFTWLIFVIFQITSMSWYFRKYTWINKRQSKFISYKISRFLFLQKNCLFAQYSLVY